MMDFVIRQLNETTLSQLHDNIHYLSFFHFIFSRKVIEGVVVLLENEMKQKKKIEMRKRRKGA